MTLTEIEVSNLDKRGLFGIKHSILILVLITNI